MRRFINLLAHAHSIFKYYSQSKYAEKLNLNRILTVGENPGNN